MSEERAPVVSVILITYNHAPYIRAAIESVLAQRTTFPIELCIGEDASDDGTRAICETYAEKHPTFIRLLRHERRDAMRIFGAPSGRHNFLATCREARGRYLAILSGDDYWTNPLKLQKQVDRMNVAPNVTLCGHRHSLVDDAGRPMGGAGALESIEYPQGSIVGKPVLFHASTYVLNAPLLMPAGIPELFWKPFNLDLILMWYASTRGAVLYLGDDMSVKRVHAGGVWSGHAFRSPTAIRASELVARSILVSIPDFPLQFRRRLAMRGLAASLGLAGRSVRYASAHGLVMGVRSAMNAFARLIRP